MTGIDGDYYYDVDSGNIYQKITGSWVLISSGISISNRAPTSNVTIPAGCGAQIIGDYEIASGYVLEIGSGSVMEIT